MKIIGALVIALVLAGCSSGSNTKTEERTSPPAPSVKKPAEPELTIRLASLNLAKLSKRIEKNDVDDLGDILKKGKIDILALQNVSRYPGVATHIDVIAELAARADMRQVFGETIALSGRQNGNAVLSVYPIKSNENTHYDGLSSNNFEAALQAIVDCGARDVVVVSTGLPERASADDQNTIANRLSSFSTLYINTPLIIAGNLPASDALRRIEQFESLKPTDPREASRLWFSNSGSLKLIDQNTEKTPLGALTVATFGLFRKSQP